MVDLIKNFGQDSPACEYFKDYNDGSVERPNKELILEGLSWLGFDTSAAPQNQGMFKGDAHGETTGGTDVYYMGDYDYGGKNYDKMSCKPKECKTCTSYEPIEAFNGGYDCGDSNTVQTLKNGRYEEGKAYYTHIEGIRPFGASKRRNWCHALDALEYKVITESGMAQDPKGNAQEYSTVYEDAVFTVDSVGECAARCKWLNDRINDGTLRAPVEERIGPTRCRSAVTLLTTTRTSSACCLTARMRV